MRWISRLAGDRGGVTALEFALVCPVMLLLMMGLGELCYTSYVRAILNGAMEKAARDSSIQGAGDQTAAIDATVIAAVRTVAHKVTYTSSRENFDKFADIGPEPFTDSNKNGKYDVGECYTDLNGNTHWDADAGASGQGGASDVTVYMMTITYPRLFPVAKMLGLTSTQTITSTAILKNQPYATQTLSPAAVCT